jgi:hypothetical protein
MAEVEREELAVLGKSFFMGTAGGEEVIKRVSQARL